MGKAADLTRERIAAEALDLLDERGVTGLTMRGVAQRLGVQAPSIYYHFKGQDDLIDAVHDLIDSEIDSSGLADSNTRDGLASFARSYRRAYLRHPDAVILVGRRPIASASALQLYECLLETLLQDGLTPTGALAAVGFLDYIVLGSVGETFRRGFDKPPTAYADRYPHLAEALTESDQVGVDEIAFEAALASWLEHVTHLGSQSRHT